MKRQAALWMILVLLGIFWTAPFGEGEQEEPAVSARAAVVMEATSGKILFAKNAEEQLSMASTTKIMTALLAAEYDRPDMEITITKKMVMVEGTSMGLLPGDKVTLEGLIYGMLLSSGNEAANAVAYTLGGSPEGFAKKMNERAAQLGMQHTSFVTASGLDAEAHYTTAVDMAILGCHAIQNARFREYCSARSARVSFGNPPYQRTLTNHNRLLNMYEHAIGIKTGFTKKSGRCLVSAAEKDGVLLVAVTLKAPDDWNDHIKMFEYAFSKTARIPANVDFSDYRLDVAGSRESGVPVQALSEPFITVLQGEENRVDRKVYLQPMEYAPLSTRQQVGVVEYTYGGRTVLTLPLYPAYPVEATTQKKELSVLEESLHKMFWVFFTRM